MRALRDQEIAALEATVQDQEEELFSLKEYKESKTMVEESMRTLAQELEEEKKMRQGKNFLKLILPDIIFSLFVYIPLTYCT